ncbi:DUF6519 domain-containing protein [Rudaea sp.]|uniref:DUF6519 domain-containing protein n=1 Tax=Rudaea sp. TaxID=2136325 RepID=UPI00321F6D10
MKGDFTRNTFDPSRHYSRVLMQQGRVQLDADWNEQAAIFTHYLRALARDLIGPHGAPVGSAGFALVTDPNLVLKADGSVLASSGDANDKALLKMFSDALAKGGNFVINPGAYYVDGIRVENTGPLLYSGQAGFDAKVFGDAGKSPALAYLDVWERHITWVEDAHIREIALGGADTTTRAQIVWQVRTGASNSDRPCDLGGIPEQPGNGRLRARAKQGAPVEPCVIAPSSTYRGAENQLYRVEILNGGSVTANNTPTFVWSRENGSVVFPIVQLGAPSTVNGASQVEATLATLGRDDKLGLHPGDWVSVVDDTAVLQNRADPLLLVLKIDRDTLTVTLRGVTPVANTGSHKLLRRWEQKTGVDASGAVPVLESEDSDNGLADKNWIALEDGIQIWFAQGATYCTGDYWLIPARVASGDIEWPPESAADGSVRQLNGNPVPAELPPAGPAHHYAPLGVFVAGGANAGSSVRSCRCLLQPATQCATGFATAAAPQPAPAPAPRNTPTRPRRPNG